MGYIYVCMLHVRVCTVYIWEQKGTVGEGLFTARATCLSSRPASAD